jgi:MFS family permease
VETVSAAADGGGQVEPVSDSTVEEAEASDQPTPSWQQRMSVVTRVGLAAVGLPLLLYIVLRPENYGLTPNSLDPMFYSGYAINFDDLLNAVGDRHYFVSRWTAYYPGYIADRLAGPFVGRLLWRLVLASVVTLSIWSLGRRLKWSRALNVLAVILALTMPVFVRAFFSDYVEYLVVALGICLVCATLREGQTMLTGFIIGLLSGAVLVANPMSVALVGLCALTALVIGARGIRQRLTLAAMISAGVGAVVLSGLVLFRWRYGIADVYKPSIDFARSRIADGAGEYKDYRLHWLGRFTWLYAAPILVAVATVLAYRRTVKFNKVEVCALLLCGAQVAIQWINQFLFDGIDLEISFYWSFSFPTFAVALAVVVARFGAGTRPSVLLAVGAGWVLFLLAGVPDVLRLPAGLLFFGLTVSVVVLLAVVAGRSILAALIVVVAFVGWTQVGAPLYDPTAHAPFYVAPNYDHLYRQAGDVSETVYHEAVWFSEEMDTVANDASTSFAPLGQWGSSITGLYAPHVDDRLVDVEPDGAHLTVARVMQIKAGFRPILAVFGPPDDVAKLIGSFPADLGVGTQLLDVTHQSALGYRLAVYAMPDATQLPFTWSSALLPIVNGHHVGDEVTVSAPDLPGFVTYGPYTYVPRGNYQVTLRYSASTDPDVPVGSFEVSSPEETELFASIPLSGTNGQFAEITLTFSSPKERSRFEFRTSWSGVGELTVRDITLADD